MLCEKCGAEIPEGKMYCPLCGQDMQIVPDFDPDIDGKIELSKQDIEGVMSEDSVSGETGAVNTAKTREFETPEELAITKKLVGTDEKTEAEEQEELRKIISEKKKKRLSLSFKKPSLSVLLGGILLFIVLLFGIIYFAGNRGGSYETHMKRASREMERGNYVSAAEEYIKAAEKHGHDPAALRGAAEALMQSGDGERAMQYLNAASAADPSDAAVYRDMLLLYEESDRTEESKSLLRSLSHETAESVLQLASDEETAERWKGYLVEPPVFSIPGGRYEGPLRILISRRDDADRVLITEDGSIPDENAKELSGELLLEGGKYTITAVCVSPSGFVSSPVAEQYEIEVLLPDPPEVMPESGTYEEPVNITAEAEDGLTVYYTIDGEEPDETSRRYEGELPMRFGRSVYRFAAMDGSGRMSETVEREFDLKFNGAIGQEDAVGFITSALLRNGTITDPEGTLPDGSRYQFSCRTCYKSGSRLYYIIYGTHINKDGEEDWENDAIYAMDYKTLDLYKGKRNTDGTLSFELLL